MRQVVRKVVLVVSLVWEISWLVDKEVILSIRVDPREISNRVDREDVCSVTFLVVLVHKKAFKKAFLLTDRVRLGAKEEIW